MLARKSKDAAAVSLEGRRILIVDDAPDNRLLLRRILTKRGAEVSEVENGLEALAVASQHDVILLDIQMPVLDGYETAQRLREDGFKGPVIALTAHAMKEERVRCLQLGCNDYLTKPIDVDRLMESLDRFTQPEFLP